MSNTRNYLFSSAWIEYEHGGVSLLVIILHCQSQVCMAWTGLVNQPLFLSHDKWRWRLLPSSVDKRMPVFIFSRTTTSSKTTCQREAYFVHLLKYSIKFTIMKAQYLSYVIFSSLIIFLCKKSCLCVICMSVCSWDKNTNLIEHKHCEPETDFATALNILSPILSPICPLTLFCFQVIFMACVEIASVKLKLVN